MLSNCCFQEEIQIYSGGHKRFYTFPNLDLASLVTPTLFYSITKSKAVSQSVDPAFPCPQCHSRGMLPCSTTGVHACSPSLLECSLHQSPQNIGDVTLWINALPGTRGLDFLLICPLIWDLPWDGAWGLQMVLYQHLGEYPSNQGRILPSSLQRAYSSYIFL